MKMRDGLLKSNQIRTEQEFYPNLLTVFFFFLIPAVFLALTHTQHLLSILDHYPNICSMHLISFYSLHGSFVHSLIFLHIFSAFHLFLFFFLVS